jgi:hypothetical protein
MPRISIAIAASVVLLVSLSTAQEAEGNPSRSSQSRGAPLAPVSVIGGDGTINYIPIWVKRNYLQSSVIYQSTAGNVGV